MTQTIYSRIGSSQKILCYREGATPVYSVSLRLPHSSSTYYIYNDFRQTDELDEGKYFLDMDDFSVTIRDINPSDNGSYVCSSFNIEDFRDENFITHVITYCKCIFYGFIIYYIINNQFYKNV